MFLHQKHTTHKHRSLRWLGILLVSIAALTQHAQQIEPSKVLEIMGSELNRSMKVLSDEPEPPFYLSYEITEATNASVSTLFGEVTGELEAYRTFYDIDLRVGNQLVDNTHHRRRVNQSVNPGPISSPSAIQNTLWLLTDREYKAATEELLRVQTRQEISIVESDAPDFTSAEKVSHIEKPDTVNFNSDKWKKRLVRVSGVFRNHDLLFRGSASASVQSDARYFVNSEGSRIHTVDSMHTVSIQATTRADDGMVLSLSEQFHARDAYGLPTDKKLINSAESLVTNLIALRNAPQVEPYTGPAILSGRASGVLFHEILGHRLEGHRLKDVSDAQTFRSKVGDRVLPERISVIFDPLLEKHENTDLLGYYKYDNEGVAGQRVEVIKEGVLNTFLFGRSTLADFPQSNGHGRKAVGFSTVARQSNLVVQVDKPYTTQDLEQQLIEILKERNLEFGLYFDDIVGGYTITSRSLPNAFNVRPVIVYKIYQDGTRELVRGVDLIGTPLTVFDNIIAAGDDVDVFNGMCGAESGNVPVSAISPSVLVGQIEVQKIPQSLSILPILPPPEA